MHSSPCSRHSGRRQPFVFGPGVDVGLRADEDRGLCPVQHMETMRLDDLSSLVVPEIARFLGISVRMFYDDHAPPHFHAIYGEYAVVVGRSTGVVEGRFPRRALRHLLEW